MICCGLTSVKDQVGHGRYYQEKTITADLAADRQGTKQFSGVGGHYGTLYNDFKDSPLSVNLPPINFNYHFFHIPRPTKQLYRI